MENEHDSILQQVPPVGQDPEACPPHPSTNFFQVLHEEELDFEDEVHERDVISNLQFSDESETDCEQQKERKSTCEKEKTGSPVHREGKPDQDNDGDSAAQGVGEDQVGEISEQFDDLEAREVKDTVPTSEYPSRRICQFFSRGRCTRGNFCKFAHVTASAKGDYRMFSRKRLLQTSVELSPPLRNRLEPYSEKGVTPRRNNPDFQHPQEIYFPAEHYQELNWERHRRIPKKFQKRNCSNKRRQSNFKRKCWNPKINENGLAESGNECEYFGESPYGRERCVEKNYNERNYVYEDSCRNERELRRVSLYDNFTMQWDKRDALNQNRMYEKKPGNARLSREHYKPRRQSRYPQLWRNDRLPETAAVLARGENCSDPWIRRNVTKPHRSRSRRTSRGSYPYLTSSSVSAFTETSATNKLLTNKKIRLLSHKITLRSLPHTRKELPSRSREDRYTRNRSSSRWSSRSCSNSQRINSFPRDDGNDAKVKYYPPHRMSSCIISSAASKSPSQSWSRSCSSSCSCSRSLCSNFTSCGECNDANVKYDPPRRADSETTENMRENRSKISESRSNFSLSKSGSTTCSTSRSRNRSTSSVSSDSTSTSLSSCGSETLYQTEGRASHERAPRSKPPVRKSAAKPPAILKSVVKLVASGFCKEKEYKASSLSKRDVENSTERSEKKDDTLRDASKMRSSGMKRPLSPSSEMSSRPAAKRLIATRIEELRKQIRAIDEAIARKRSKTELS